MGRLAQCISHLLGLLIFWNARPRRPGDKLYLYDALQLLHIQPLRFDQLGHDKSAGRQEQMTPNAIDAHTPKKKNFHWKAFIHPHHKKKKKLMDRRSIPSALFSHPSGAVATRVAHWMAIDNNMQTFEKCPFQRVPAPQPQQQQQPFCGFFKWAVRADFLTVWHHGKVIKPSYSTMRPLLLWQTGQIKELDLFARQRDSQHSFQTSMRKLQRCRRRPWEGRC